MSYLVIPGRGLIPDSFKKASDLVRPLVNAFLKF
jgi:hypothetical protein